MASRDLLIRILGDPGGALKAFRETESGAGRLGTGLDKLGKIAAATFVAAGAATIAFGVSSVKAFSSTAAAIDDLQDVTGESAEAMSRMKYAFDSWGVSAEEQNTAMKAFVKAIGAGKEAFARYGIATRDAAGKALPLSQILANTSDVFRSMPDGVDKAALAFALFGKQGDQLLDVLNEGGDGLRKLGDEAERFGLVLGQDSVDAQQKNAAAQRRLSAAWKGMQVQLGEHLLPIVAKVVSWMGEHMPAAIATIKSVVERLMPVFRATASVVTWLFGAIQSGVGWLIEHKPILIGVAAAISTLLVAAFVSWAISAATAAAATLAATWPIIAVGVAIAALVAGIVWLVEHFDTVKKVAGEVWDWIADKVTTSVNMAMVPIRAVASAASALWDGLTSATETAWNAVERIISPIVDAIKATINGIISAFKAVWNAVASTWNSTIGKVSIHIPDWVPVVGGKGFDMPDLPKLHTGGRVPGLTGQEVPVLARAGETVRTAAQEADVQRKLNGGTGIVQQFYGITNESELARRAARELGWALRAA